MGIVVWIALGLVAGLLAHFIMRSKVPGGLVVTTLIGIGGALLGGFIATQLGFGSISGFDLRSIAIAVGGAILLLILVRMFLFRLLLESASVEAVDFHQGALMHKAAATLIAIVMLASFSFAEDATTAPATRPTRLRKDVGVEEFDKLYKEKRFVVLDVRTSREFQQGHIPGAVNVDFNAAGFAKKMQEMDPDQVYLVHCASGFPDARACDKLEKLKFIHLFNLLGGFDAWKRDGKPVEAPSPAGTDDKAQK